MKKNQINTKIFLTVLIFIVALVPSITASLLYYRSEHNSIARQASNYEEQILIDMRGSFEDMQGQLNKIQYEITSHFVALGMEKIDSTNLKEGEVEKIHILESLLQSMRRTTSGINNIYVIKKENAPITYGSTYTYNKRRLLESEWLKEPYTSSKNWKVIPDHETGYLSSTIQGVSSDSCFSFVTGLVNKDGDNEFEYVLQIDMKTEYVYSLIHSILVNENDSMALYDLDGKLIESINLSDEKMDILNNMVQQDKEITQLKNYIISKTEIPELEMSVYKVSDPFQNIQNNNLALQILILVSISVLVAVLAATVIKSSFVRPFEQLIRQTMITIDDTKELQKVSLESRSSDIKEIIEHFNRLVDRINQLIKSTLAQEEEKRDLEIKMLQAQINPHFLYNTLNSIKWMALIKDQPDIAEAVTALVDMLEYCCKDTNTLVSLKDEIAFLKDYVQIQKMRNSDDTAKVIWEIDEEVMDCKIIKLSLQPGLENSFVHAFPENKKGAEITVAARKNKDRLILTIKDNGVGFDESVVDKNLTGIGIKNIDNRIKLTFGEEYGQVITSKIGEGTTVVLLVPVICKDECTDGK